MLTKEKLISLICEEKNVNGYYLLKKESKVCIGVFLCVLVVALAFVIIYGLFKHPMALLKVVLVIAVVVLCIAVALGLTFKVIDFIEELLMD